MTTEKMNGSEAGSAANADQIAYWNDTAGLRWASLQVGIDRVFAPLTAAALAFAAPQPGTKVIDIGCGSGTTVLRLAELVGVSGTVHGVDVSKPMLAVAERRVAEAGCSQVSLLLADAATHGFAPRAFDLVFSRFGVMFFADPVAAFTNIRAGLADKGRIVFACWQAIDRNPWFEVPVAALRAFQTPKPPVDPSAPGPFAFADLDRVRGILNESGFVDVVIEPHQTIMHLGTLTAAVDFVSQVGPASRVINDVEPEGRPPMIDTLRSALSQYDSIDGIVLGGAIWLVSAQVG